MGLIKRLLGGGTTPPTAEGITQELVNTILSICNILLAVVGVAAVAFMIWIGFRLAKAEDEGKRKEAKKQLLWTLVAVIAVVLLVTIWNTAIKGFLNDAVTH